MKEYIFQKYFYPVQTRNVYKSGSTRTSGALRIWIGSAPGACDGEEGVYQKLIENNMRTRYDTVDEWHHSAAYDTMRNIKITHMDLE